LLPASGKETSYRTGEETTGKFENCPAIREREYINIQLSKYNKGKLDSLPLAGKIQTETVNSTRLRMQNCLLSPETVSRLGEFAARRWGRRRGPELADALVEVVNRMAEAGYVAAEDEAQAFLNAVCYVQDHYVPPPEDVERFAEFMGWAFLAAREAIEMPGNVALGLAILQHGHFPPPEASDVAPEVEPYVRDAIAMALIWAVIAADPHETLRRLAWWAPMGLSIPEARVLARTILDELVGGSNENDQ